jgi:hypothetical protein
MKTEWKDRKEPIGNLNLDLQNPRVPKYEKDHKDVVEVRNYLIEKEGVLKIAESIAVSGYHRSVTAIVCEEGGKLIVWMGTAGWQHVSCCWTQHLRRLPIGRTWKP